ncbi:hypothetical protein BTVI_47909 [Pitangus sulphuratus]|nr:hypothetical protein BTVI_47909 [Pitangus sulphuratus]
MGMPSGNRTSDMGRIQRCCLSLQGENSWGQSSTGVEGARNVGDNKKSAFEHINSSRRYRNIIGPFQGEDGHLANTVRDKAELFDALFASVFNTDDGPREPQCPELEDHDCENHQFPVDPEIVWNRFLQVDPYKYLVPDGIHLRILKKLLISKHNLSQRFLSSFGNLERSQLTGSR